MSTKPENNGFSVNQKPVRDGLPVGFEHESDDKVVYKVDEIKKANSNLGFGRRGGRGPGAAAAVEKPKDMGKSLKRLIKYLGAEGKLIAGLMIAAVVTTGASLISPSLQGSSIDAIAGMLPKNLEKIGPNGLTGDALKAYQWGLLRKFVLLLIIVYAVNILFSLAQTLISANVSQRMVRRMRHDLFRKIDNLEIGYLDTHSNGDIMSRMTNDVENISNTISQSIGSLISAVLTVFGTIIIMFCKCWQLTLISLSTCILTVVVTKYMTKAMRKIYLKRSTLLGRLNGHSEEMITGFKSIVANNREDEVMDEFNSMSEELRNVSIKAEILGGTMGPLMNCISNISFVIVAAFGGYFALKGYISVGVISAFILYSKQFSRPINEIAQLYGSVQTALAGAERVFEILDMPDEDNSGDLEIEFENVRGEISFKDINFSYVPGKQVIFDFNLNIEPGQKIALVGSTGSGKTTILNLLMRYYKPDSGEILIDGINIFDIKRDCLRDHTAIVLQDTVLFSDTIRNNIKYADTSDTDENMVAAAKMSNADYFIDRLPEKYDTFLKQAGASISQGQRQLLAIARAVYSKPKILVLDEATSSVDTRTEKSIQDAMQNLMKSRTSLIVAHRLSTVRDADVIVVMDQGRIAETGNHDELLAKHGVYYNLYMTQFAGNQI